ncbi:extracellular solute-binding protein [Devosia geojensis]|nr:extracellular solute-binding protein [Devosia geojensis]
MSVFTVSRRTVLKGGAAALGAMALSPLAALAQTARFPIAEAARNPLNLAEGTAIEGIFFEGGYGIDYINHAADVMKELHAGTQISVTGIQGVADRLRPRFIAGNPPDVIDNAGAGSMDTSALRTEGQMADLAPLMAAPALDTPDKTFAETLFAGSQTGGVYEGKQVSLTAPYTVHGIWYDQALMRENGWEYPRTWSAMLDFCETLKSAGHTPWAYGGRNAAHYLVRGIVYPLIYKLAGRQAVDDIMTAKEGAWLKPEVLEAARMVAELGKGGFIMDGSEALSHTEAQAEWLLGGAVFYPCGSWIENEMRDVIPQGYEMTMSPIPGPTEETFNSVLAVGSETFFVPSAAKNITGGMEFLRCLFSRSTAAFYAETAGVIMPVQGVEVETLSSAVKSAMAAVTEAGEDVFPLDLPYQAVWQAWGALSPELLQGRLSPEDYVAGIEEASASARQAA